MALLPAKSPTSPATTEGAYTGMIVIIPTRNRSDFVRRSLRSLGLQKCAARVRVLVSDNSTDQEEAEKCRSIVTSINDPRVMYVRPPAAMPMTEHWDWIAQYALASWAESHVLYVTDRMAFKPGGVDRLEAMVRLYPHKIISYPQEQISDREEPVSYRPGVSSRRAFRISSASVLERSSRLVIHVSAPRMLNCVVPRAVMQELRNKFGTFFSSISPDYNFCFRALAVIHDYIYFDDPICVSYGFNRSNGTAFRRGLVSKDSKDFVSNLPGGQWVFPSAPVPHIPTVVNAVAHEYNAVRHELNGGGMPSIEWASYLAANARAANDMEDPVGRLAVREALVGVGYVPPTPIAKPTVVHAARARAAKILMKIITLKAKHHFPDTASALDSLFAGNVGQRTMLDGIRGMAYARIAMRDLPAEAATLLPQG